MHKLGLFLLFLAFCNPLRCNPLRCNPLQADTINDKLADIDAALDPTLVRLFKTGPTLVDTAEYESQIRDQLAHSELTPAQQAEVLKNRLPDYVEDFKETLIADAVKDRMAELPGLKIERITHFDAPEDANALAPARDYYLKEHGEAVSDVAVVLGHWRGEIVAMYATPLFGDKPSEGNFADHFTFAGKTVRLQFHWRATLQNADYYFHEAYRALFGSPYVMFVSSQELAKPGPWAISSLVHELRHYFDSLHPSPELSPESRQTEPERLQKIWDGQHRQLQDDDFATLEATAEGQSFLAARVWLLAQVPVNQATAQVRADAEQTFKEEYLDTLKYRFFYLNQARERVAYREQVRYLRDQAGFTKEALLYRMTHMSPEALRSTVKVVLKNGTVVPLVVPPMPHDLRYFSELYDEK